MSDFTRVGRSFALVILSVGAVFFMSLALGALRQPAASPVDPLAGIELKREALAGTDALLERGVLPPGNLDWIMVDCSNSDLKESSSAAIRKTLCENSKQARN